MGINTESDIEANPQIGPTDQGMVRIYVFAGQLEIPMDFEPEEAQEIAEEILAAAKAAETLGQNANAKAARQDRESVAGVTRHFLQISEPSFYDVQVPVCPRAPLSQSRRHRHRR